MKFRPVRAIGSLLRAITGTVSALASEDIEWPTTEKEIAIRTNVADVELHKVLQSSLSSRQQLMAGTIQLVSMGGIKEELGNAWPGVAERAGRIAQQEIQQVLKPPDVHSTVSDDTFILCFVEADRSEVEAFSVTLSSKIRARLLREIPELAGRLAVEEFTSEVDSGAILAGELPPTDALFAALLKLRAEASQAARRFQSEYLQDIRILFQPVWDVRRRRSSFNRCLLDPLSSNRVIGYLQSLSEHKKLADAVAQLDCLLLTRSVEGLHRALDLATSKPTIIIPVQFSTLSEGDAADRYLSLLQLVPSWYKRYVGLEVQGVPSAADPLAILDAIELIEPYAATVVLKLSPNDVRVGEDMQSVLWGLSVDLGQGISEPAQEWMPEFVHEARHKGLRTLAYGANTFGLAQGARDAGFHLIGGSAIHLNTDVPKPPAALTPYIEISDVDLANHRRRNPALEAPADRGERSA